MRYYSLIPIALLAARPALAQNSDRAAQLEACRAESRLLHPPRAAARTQAEQQRRAFMADCMARKGYKLR
jgi:hypothetical protein